MSRFLETSTNFPSYHRPRTISQRYIAPKPNTRAPVGCIKLSAELHDTIIDFLCSDVPALTACSLVCTSWLPRSRYHLWKHVRMDNFNADEFAKLLPSSSVFLHYIREIELDQALVRPAQYGRSNPFDSFFGEARRMDDQSFKGVCSAINRLWRSWKKMAPYLDELTSVKSLRMRAVFWDKAQSGNLTDAVVQTFANITELDLDDVGFYDTQHVAAFLNNFQDLEELSLAVYLRPLKEIEENDRAIDEMLRELLDSEDALNAEGDEGGDDDDYADQDALQAMIQADELAMQAEAGDDALDISSLILDYAASMAEEDSNTPEPSDATSAPYVNVWPHLRSLHLHSKSAHDCTKKGLISWLLSLEPFPTIRDLSLCLVCPKEAKSCDRLLRAIGEDLHSLSMSFLFPYHPNADTIYGVFDLSTHTNIRTFHYTCSNYDMYTEYARLDPYLSLLLPQIHSTGLATLKFTFNIQYLTGLNAQGWEDLSKLLALPQFADVTEVRFELHYDSWAPSERFFREKLNECDARGVLRFEFCLRIRVCDDCHSS